MAHRFPWYELVDGEELQQGDIFRGFPILRPSITSDLLDAFLNDLDIETPVEVLTGDVVLLTQSCDLANDKVDTVILCTVWDLAEYENSLGSSPKEITKRKELIRQGKEPSFHMLAASENPAVQLSLVEFKRIYTSPKDILTQFAISCGSRVRLLPPYREHLSQAFARYFMRVGLPSDIPRFK